MLEFGCCFGRTFQTFWDIHELWAGNFQVRDLLPTVSGQFSVIVPVDVSCGYVIVITFCSEI